MNTPAQSTVFCPECGVENLESLTQCQACQHPLDPIAAHSLAAKRESASRPFHLKTFGLMAGIALLVVVVAQLTGLTFSLAVLPDEPVSGTIERLEALDKEGLISQRDVMGIARDLQRQELIKAELKAGNFDGAEQMDARSQLRPEGEGLVLGIGGMKSLAPPLGGTFLAALIVAIAFRVRRPFEVIAGAGVAMVGQLVLWLVAVEFAVGALGWDVIMLGKGVGFGGAPALLLGMTMVLSVVASVLGAYLGWTAADLFGGTTGCTQCEHKYSLRKHPSECPKCGFKRKKGARYRANDDVFADLGGAANQVTRAAMGASELLCLRCAKTYEADACPVHPHEPLLDPRQDAVRYQLLEMDAQAGTKRFSKWTGDGLGVDAAGPAVPVTSGPRLCMECAKTYETEACPTHPHEPLLDPSLEAVRIELIAADDRARGRMSTMLMFAAATASGVLTAGVGLLADFGLTLWVGVFAALLVPSVTVAAVMAPKLAPPRFSRWTGEGDVDLDEFGMGANAMIFAPMKRWVERMRREVVRLVIATVVGAAIGVGLMVAVDGSIAAGAMLGGFLVLLGYAGVTFVIERAKAAGDAVRQAKQEWDDPYAMANAAQGAAAQPVDATLGQAGAQGTAATPESHPAQPTDRAVGQ